MMTPGMGWYRRLYQISACYACSRGFSDIISPSRKSGKFRSVECWAFSTMDWKFYLKSFSIIYKDLLGKKISKTSFFASHFSKRITASDNKDKPANALPTNLTLSTWGRISPFESISRTWVAGISSSSGRKTVSRIRFRIFKDSGDHNLLSISL